MRKLIVLILLVIAWPAWALDIDVDNNNATDVEYGGTNATTASGARTALGLAIGTDVQAYDADLTTYAGITPSANVQTMLGSADNSAIRSNIGLAIGTNVQAYDADLDSLAAGITGPVKGAGNAGGYSAAGYADIIGLFDSGLCSGFLKSDGTCETVSSDVLTVLSTIWTAAPTGDDLKVGVPYWADNDTWDPCSVTGTDNYQTFWNGSAWVCTQDINGNLFIDSISESVPISDADGTGTLTYSFAFSDARTGTIPGDASFSFAIVSSATDNAFSYLQSFNAGLSIGNGATGAGFLRLKEDSDNGTDYSTITGASDAGSYPSFTFGGSQGSEDLTLTASSNQWTLSSSTGVTTFSAGSLSFVTTGTISGAMPSTTDSNGMTISTAEGYGYIHWATGAGTWILPSAAAGMNLCVYSTTAAAVVVDAATGDQIKPTTNATGDSITNDSTAGSFVCLVAADATDWHVLGIRGTWTDTN